MCSGTQQHPHVNHRAIGACTAMEYRHDGGGHIWCKSTRAQPHTAGEQQAVSHYTHPTLQEHMVDCLSRSEDPQELTKIPH